MSQTKAQLELSHIVEAASRLGVKVNEADKDAFIAASKSIYQEFGDEVPGSTALIEQAIALGK